MFKITVNVNNSSYTFRKRDDFILINEKPYKMELSEFNEEEQKDIKSVYKSYLSIKNDKTYAKYKAYLYFAPYIETCYSIAIELMDNICIYLLGALPELPELKKNMMLKIQKEYIFVVTDIKENKKKIDKYYIPETSSSLTDYNTIELLNVLISQSNNS